MPLKIDREQLDVAVRRGILTPEQADALWRDLEPAPPPTSGRRPGRRAELAFLAGGLTGAAAAAGLLLLAWNHLGGASAGVASVALAGALVVAARALHRRSQAAAALLVAAAVAMVPIAINGLLGLGIAAAAPPADLGGLLVSRAFVSCGATVAAAALAVAAFPHPALGGVVVAAVWCTAMAAAPFLFGASPSWNQRALLSALVGVIALGTAFGLDRRTRRDWASPLYLAGLVALWGGLTTYHASSELSVALYAALNAALVLYAVVLGRRVFAVFGAVGLAGAIGHLAERQLEPWALPVVLAAIALGLAGAGLAFHRHAPRFGRAIVGLLPARLRRLLPPGAGRSPGSPGETP